MTNLYIDIETYSPEDIKSTGAYKYIASPEFEIIILGFAFDDEDVTIVDLLQGEKIPKRFIDAMHDPSVVKHAHNAVFERLAFRRIGIDVPASQWRCTAIKAAYCGLPLSLEQVSKRLDLKDKKLDTGKALIKLFSCPCKPTKANGMRTRNFPEDAPEQWELYKEYNAYDVLAEREIDQKLKKYAYPEFEQNLYILDQDINDRGILIDRVLCESAVAVDDEYSKILFEQSQSITNLDNPNSAAYHFFN